MPGRRIPPLEGRFAEFDSPATNAPDDMKIDDGFPTLIHDEPIRLQWTDPTSSSKLSWGDRRSQLKLQILAEPAIKDLSWREDTNGFAHIGLWLGAGKMRTDMTLAVEEGKHW